MKGIRTFERLRIEPLRISLHNAKQSSDNFAALPRGAIPCPIYIECYIRFAAGHEER